MRPDHAARPTTTVTPYPDGPLIVRGDFALCDMDGAEVYRSGPVALCRCGRSATKPLCDGSHKVIPRSGRARA